MKYFVFDYQRNGSCYHEFYKGKWDGHTHWKADSIMLDDDLLCNGFVDAIIEIVPDYGPYGVTEISFGEWKEIGNVILTKDKMSQELYSEADKWLRKVFEDYSCFTILGI